jgi:UDP-N-acetylmuramate: L-alanyl-gamma-D-glutamyl-meso-diaminopimelate ligase
VTREHVHLIGIGGTGMTALAGLLAADGCRVTGSDGALYPPTSIILERLGLELCEGFDAANLRPAPDLVVIGNAASRGNPELEATLDRNLSYTSMPRLISERFLRDRHSIVVAGTHGKTSTTSMLAWVLEHAGREPGFLVGGLPQNFEYPFQLGRGQAFVIEGDEYDSAFFDKGPKFMHYRPDTALLGTIEFDHADIYRDFAAVQTAFKRLVNLVPRRGLIVHHEDCAVTHGVVSAAHSRVEGYGLESGGWRASALRDSPEGASFNVTRDGAPFGEVRLLGGGEHNVRNALAVIAAATEQGLTREEILAGLASFRGVRRRLEVRGEADGIVVLDDFAHHPTAIDTTLRAVRNRYSGGRVWAVVEPRSWSLRRSVFQEQLVSAFDAADEVIVADVFRAEEIPDGERLDPERLVRELRERGARARHLGKAPTIVERIAEEGGCGDVVVVMSNGAFDGLHDALLTTLAARAEAARG